MTLGDVITNRLGVIAAIATVSYPTMLLLGFLHSEHPSVPPLGYLVILVTLTIAEQIVNLLNPLKAGD